MTHKFKPGDKVRTKAIVRTVRCVDRNGPGPLLHFEDNLVARPQNVELVEPVVTHRKLREVLEELTKTTLQNDFNAGWNDALDAFFTQATGEQP